MKNDIPVKISLTSMLYVLAQDITTHTTTTTTTTNAHKYFYGLSTGKHFSVQTLSY